MSVNFHRLAAVIRTTILDRRRSLLSFTVGSMLFILLLDTLIAATNAHMPLQVLNDTLGNFNVFFLLIASTLVCSMAFSDLGRKVSATNLLMLPASELEKFLSRWLIAVPFFTIILLVEASISDILSSAFTQLLFGVKGRGTFGWINYCRQPEIIGLLSPVFLFLQSFFFLGSLLWPRFSWGKSFISLAVIAIMCLLCVITVITTIRTSSNMGNIDILSRKGIEIIALVMTAVNYFIAYFRFREAETINRW